jgi:hypothetical protein
MVVDGAGYMGDSPDVRSILKPSRDHCQMAATTIELREIANTYYVSTVETSEMVKEDSGVTRSLWNPALKKKNLSITRNTKDKNKQLLNTPLIKILAFSTVF